MSWLSVNAFEASHVTFETFLFCTRGERIRETYSSGMDVALSFLNLTVSNRWYDSSQLWKKIDPRYIHSFLAGTYVLGKDEIGGVAFR